MKNGLTILFLLYCSIISFGQSKLTNYQKKILGDKIIASLNEAEKYVSIDWYVNDPAQAFEATNVITKKDMFNLTEKGQKAFIEAVSEKTANNDLTALLSGLSSPLTRVSRPEIYEVDKTKFVKKIELDVNDKLRLKGGRIAELYFQVKIGDDSIIRFLEFRNIATKHEVVDFGSIGLARNRNFSLNAGVEFGGTGSNTITNTTDSNTDSNTINTSNTSNLGASYSMGRTITEELALKIRRIAMKGTIGPMTASIYQEGYPSINLNDKVTVELVFEATKKITKTILTFDGLFDSSGKAVTDVNKLKINKCYVTLPQLNIDSNVTAELLYEFVYREVINNKGRNSVGEWDDKILYNRVIDKNVTSKSVPFLSQSELETQIWYLGEDNNKLWLNYFGRIIQLKFLDSKSADDLLLWLQQTKQTTFKNSNFMIGSSHVALTPLTTNDIDKLGVDIDSF